MSAQSQRLTSFLPLSWDSLNHLPPRAPSLPPSLSHHDAWGIEPWKAALCELLRHLAKAGVRILATCFGCQLASRAFGGGVGRNPSGKASGAERGGAAEGDEG